MTITDRDPEFIGTITALYQDELGRAPDPGGLAAWLEQCRNGMTGEELRHALHESPEGVAYRNKPKPPPLPSLTVQGINFVQDGQRIVLNGVDAFRAFRMFLDGEDLTPLFDESKAIGFNLWRVFLMGSVAQNGLLDLRPTIESMDKLRPFAELLNSHGVVLLGTVFVDAQDVMTAAHIRQSHWIETANRLRGSMTLLSGGNEWRKNGFDPGELSDPAMLWSRGSNVADDMPFLPSGSFAEFHPRRDLPAALMDTVASPVFIYKSISVPLIIDEPPRMGDQGSGAEYADPFICYKFARHYATECAGAVFHSRSGQVSQVMDPVTRACAEAWTKGMRL